jgi:uncharacterized protein
MKKILFITVSMLISCLTIAQDISGKWNGVLKVPGMELRVSFNVTISGEVYSATMDSPDQGAFGIPMTSAEYKDKSLKITHTMAGIIYLGTIGTDETITGTFTQAGQVFPLNLTRNSVVKTEINRPQDPIQPYPYYSEDVVVRNDADSLDLAATLTLPSKEGKYPVVILISGSGPQNRNEELLGHRPFLVLSDYLTRNGIAVLRFDDRGTGQSTGVFNSATSADFANDVKNLINYLKLRPEIDQEKIGLIGHSEGGIIAPIVASTTPEVDFIVLMAGTGVRGRELLLMQQEAIGRASGTSEDELELMSSINRKAFDIVLQNNDNTELKIKLTDYLMSESGKFPGSQKPQGMSDKDFVDMIVTQTTTPWMLYFIKHDPAPILEKVKCPVLAINGSMDLQVPAKINLEMIKTSLSKAGNQNVTIKELDGLNHLFQECTTGAPSEYAGIEQTISPNALEAILTWIKGVASVI